MLAHLLRTDLLPAAHMISGQTRPLRDVLRTRLKLVQRRVAAQSMAVQNSIARLLEKDNARDVAELDAFGRLQAQAHIEQAELLHAQVERLESALVPHLVPDADSPPRYCGVQRLLRIPGVGKACAFSIRLEVDDVSRLASDRAFFSYCRVVPGADSSGDRVRNERSRDGNPDRGRSGLSQTRLQPRRPPGDAVLPGGARVVPGRETRRLSLQTRSASLMRSAEGARAWPI